MTAGPATHPSWPIAHAKESTPEPITAVTMCALAVHTVPVKISKLRTVRKQRIQTRERPFFLLTSSLEAAVVVEAFGSSLRQAKLQGGLHGWECLYPHHQFNSEKQEQQARHSTQREEGTEAEELGMGRKDGEGGIYMSKTEQGKHVVEVERRWSTRVDALCLPQSATRL
ncbi:hypothetical protein BHE74_00049517 [Ensete ventricosum]|nr:hypothetical protein BHE74_00049517 [Ensete ventricosum]